MCIRDRAVREGVGFITEAPYRSMILDNMSATENVSVPLHEKVRGFWLSLIHIYLLASRCLHNEDCRNMKSGMIALECVYEGR